MHSIDIKEKKLLQEWASDNRDEKAFERRGSTGIDSYFLTRSSEETYITPYRFRTIPQFQEKINEICGTDIALQQQKLLAVAMFKCRTMHIESFDEEQKKESIDSEKIPKFTYAF